MHSKRPTVSHTDYLSVIHIKYRNQYITGTNKAPTDTLLARKQTDYNEKRAHSSVMAPATALRHRRYGVV